MSFDWTTFSLEFINFLILLWILRRFLYRPVLEVIAARQQKIEAQLREAEATRAAALAAKTECEQQLLAWDEAKTQARLDLDKTLAAERERRLAALADEIAEARAKHAAQDQRERQEWAQRTEQRALELGSRFVTKLLERTASPPLEAELVALVLADLPALPSADVDRLRAALAEDGLDIVSAFPLTPAQRAALAEAFAQLAGRAVNPVFREEPGLLAGVRIHVGPWLLGANLRDELRFFRDVEPTGHG